MSAPSDPIARFQDWLRAATESEPNDPGAMALASVGADGMPSLRMVLLKHVDEAGFVFYTNFESLKGVELLARSKAALCFHWKSLRRQVRVEGDVGVVTDAEADEYFASRARDSRIGAWASEQSRAMTGRFELERRVARFAAQYAVGEIPRPPHWSGFRLTPRRIEFWRDRPFRLHERHNFTRAESGWRMETLYP